MRNGKALVLGLDKMTKEERLERMRHSAAHIMAEAVCEMFPDARLGIGPPIDTGFYYDFELPRTLTTEDLPVVEEKMRTRIKSDVPFEPSQITKDEARERFHDQPYKLELIDEIRDEKVGLYQQGEFVDLCQGPHVERTGQVPAFKLMSVAGAYWRGDEHNPMLQRVYGALFDTKEELEQYLERIEEAHRRDHRRLGRELDLFSFHEEFGPGLVYWHPKGGRVRTLIEDFWREEHLRAGYDIVYSPHIGKSTLWETSGHLDFYAENMYSPMDIDGQDYYVKPMNCPFHIQMYKNSLRSYRELPIRLAELGTVYRYERSGVLHGLLRVRGFTQDDAHIFCMPSQIEAEVEACIDFAFAVMKNFGFDKFEVELSDWDPKHPENYAGKPEDWHRATAALASTMERLKIPFKKFEGEAAFYGPKIDVKLIDAIGRPWQLSTVQFDFSLPVRFGLEYVGADGRAHTPLMVHRALLGSVERFFGVLIEHYAGAFPLWLAPVQAIVLPIAHRHLVYGASVRDRLQAAGVRVVLDERQEKVNYKIREAQLRKIPYMLVVGDREVNDGTVSVRTRTGGDRGGSTIDGFIAAARDEIANKGRLRPAA